jgi:glycosyltransferase involved in cell wall biosynthesis
MKILLVHNYYQQRGGEDSVVANERALLEQSGHDVDLFSAHNKEISGLAAKWNSFKNVTYNEGIRQIFVERLERARPDVVHVHNTFPLISPSVYDACAEAGLPVVQTLHNFRTFCAGSLLLRKGKICELCLDGRPYRAVAYRCYRGSFLGSLATARLIDYHNRHRTWATKVARFIALSEFARKKFIDAGFPPERMIVKPNFVLDPGETASGHREGLIFVGRLSPEKGLSHLVRALSGSNIQLRILGDGPERAALESQASPNIIFEGLVSPERVREAMRMAKILVLPSISYDNMPVCVVEAFASGLPVIATRLGSLPEIVADGVTGRLVAPADAAALRETATELLSDPQRLTAMSIAARRRYESHYSPERHLEQLLAIYKDAIQEIAGPASVKPLLPA